MTEDNRRENCIAEVDRGDAALGAANTLLSAGFWDDAVSRAYYAVFHHVRALLFSAGLEAKTHSGTHDLFYRHFIKPGTLPSDLIRKLVGLQKYREQADYSAAIRFDEEGARTEVANAEQACQTMRAYLVAQGWLEAAP